MGILVIVGLDCIRRITGRLEINIGIRRNHLAAVTDGLAPNSYLPRARPYLCHDGHVFSMGMSGKSDILLYVTIAENTWRPYGC